ncbi:AmmeMemoRadiSam system protein B [Aliifodinibius salicampi]|uniref:AmmeMemoRadiSam system protein B n=1 Tax=Fodinibius salicampi TaxID=1920655 RepID=A0ABT3PYJ2_9BACT|nr:AmmeMemoRadiSam system protein B [Fodinibius salicampi]MCW9712920.1 AmmeMemoRadiSam system protein B [Fodinibius salicampi]
MKTNDLFDSLTDPIPQLRRDIQVIPVQNNGSSYLYFHDSRGYVPSDFALHRETETLLSLIDGRKSINDLKPYFGDEVSVQQLKEFVQFLDKNRLLSSGYYQSYARKVESQYEQSTIHTSNTAGNSYPADPNELKGFLGNSFDKHDSEETNTSAKALYAPHIDPRIALDSYIKAFAPIRNLKPKRVVMIATSHYAGLYPDTYQERPFILVNKDFELPLGTIRRDQESIQQLLDSDCGITTHDRAHRTEHSIELHLLFLSYLWDHDFQIIPFLVRNLDELYYMEDGHLGEQLKDFSQLMDNNFSGDPDTFFLISGDLAHFGKKFGDSTAASDLFNEVEHFDRQFLEYGSQNRRDLLLKLMKEETDPYRICGFPPLYTFLNIMPGLKGKILDYDLWDERERKSAVTFGSILYS